MAAAEALRTIRGLARAARYVISEHAAKRMNQRNVRPVDIRCALAGATACAALPDDRWKTTGPDLDGDALSCVVVIEGDVVVITVF
ncbi:MAG: DUF4258 domain-containing protein [Myxococcales bacterium]|nr:DUF4258 domain-containing protein [Myxococcales bacterium]